VVPAGTTDLTTATWKASSTAGLEESTVEHIFAEIPTSGAYEIWVENSNFFFGGGPYALAWMMTAPPMDDEVPGDYDGSGTIGPEDYDAWTASFGDSVAAGTGADGNGNGVVDAADYVVWRKHLEMGGSGSQLAMVPEPAGAVLFLVAITLLGAARRRRKEDNE
jgi:hypothetical protein